MLYMTTRSNHDVFTAHRALHESVSPDGGRFVPFRFPEYSSEDLEAMCRKTISENIADMLNVFFSAHLSVWDIDFLIGRNAIRLSSVNHKITVAELWHNPGGNFDYIVQSLFRKISVEFPLNAPSEWFLIAVRIALYFAVYCDLCSNGRIAIGEPVDISVPYDNCISLMASCYAKRMGLPVGMIICTSVDNAILWDLIHKNEVATTDIDTEMRLGIERYLHCFEGYETVSMWQNATQSKRVFSVSADEEKSTDANTYCVVTGLRRCDQMINSVFRSGNYLTDPLSAVCFAGLQDYRTQSAASRAAIILAEQSPFAYAEKIAEVTGISAAKLPQYIENKQ